MRFPTQTRGRRGTVLPLVAMCTIAMMGMVALAMGLGPTTELNLVYHRVILGVLVVGLVLLVSTPGRRALRGREGRQARDPRQAA